MEWTNSSSSRLSLWEAAIDSGLGLLSAYITPEQYGLASVSLAARAQTDEDIFLTEIQSRIELAKARLLSRLIQEAESTLKPAFQHSVHYAEMRLEGALLVPRLLHERANNRFRTIPVLQTRRTIETPEALLISESIRLSIRVCNYWRRKGGAEGKLANNLARDLMQIEARPPWSELKARPRPVIRNLAGIVKSRVVAGWSGKGSTIDRIADLLLSDAKAVEAAAGMISFMVSDDERYEDRLFELICLGWILGALQRTLDSYQVHERHFRTGKPLLTGTVAGVEVKVYYQAQHLPGHYSYRWKRTGKVLRSIPDFVIETTEKGKTKTLLVDAKNRARSSLSEIIYKMLGYKENLQIEPYWGLGIAPTFSSFGVESVARGANKVAVAFVPLKTGQLVVQRAVYRAIRS